MPLGFDSSTHGRIAFGFFNIESDMLLLENLFFFSHRFCTWIEELAGPEQPAPLSVEVMEIDDPGAVGDLMGAIHGVRFTGFIGRLYQLFPFPADPAKFKQNPDGDQTRDIVTGEISAFAARKTILLSLGSSGEFNFGPFRFDGPVFHELIRYVWQGGYPRWKDEIRPTWVKAMKTAVQNSPNPNFKGVFP